MFLCRETPSRRKEGFALTPGRKFHDTKDGANFPRTELGWDSFGF
jgi:hypothetical protein